MEADVQPDASSASPVTPDASDVLASLSPDEHLEWRKSGNLPDRSIDAEATAAEPVEQAASTDATPERASEPAKKPKGVKARTAELDSEIQSLQERLRIRKELEAELTRRGVPDAKPAESSPAATAAKADAEPDPTDLETYPEGQFDRKFIKDTAKWEARQLLTARDTQAQEQAKYREFTEFEAKRVEAFTGRMNEAAEADPTFLPRLSASKIGKFKTTAKAAMDGEKKGPDNYITDAIVSSKWSTQLLEHLMLEENAEDLAELQAAESIPDVAVRVARLEGYLKRAAKAQSTPQPRTVSRAPAPPSFLGSRTANPADPIEDARKRNDVGAYLAAMNASELAAARK